MLFIVKGSEDRLGDSTMIDIKIGKDVTKKRFPYEVSFSKFILIIITNVWNLIDLR